MPNNMNAKKFYLFDFDGTLVNSMPSYIKGMLRILDEAGVKYEKDIIKIITPLGFVGTAEYFIKNFGLKATKEELLIKMEEYIKDDYFYIIPAKSNVEKTLKELKNKGASLNVLTASPHVTLDACLKRLNLFDLFDNVWSCNDFNTTKADPEIYKMVAKKLGVNVNDILFLDDNLNADKTAKLAGAKVCGVYDESSKDYASQIKAVVDFYIYDFIELLDIKF